MPGGKNRQTFVRAWAPKRRTGCITCKIRHVKCDEAKPNCISCTSTGRKCDGYAPTTVTRCSSRSVSSVAPLPSLSILPNVESREHRAFDYFLACTAVELSGYFSPDVWEQKVPTLCLSESALFHIVIALSSVHEGFANGNKVSNQESQQFLYSYALKHYAIAIKGLKEAIRTNPENLQSILLCCALFVCFDSLRGYYRAALTHLHSGLKIMSGKKSTGGEISQDNGIVRVFTCLAIQTGSFINSHLPEPTDLIWEEILEINEGEREVSIFTSIDDARHILNLLICDFMLQHTRAQFSHTYATVEKTVKTSNVREKLEIWTRTFDTMILKKDPKTLSAKNLRASVLLKLHHSSLTAMVDTFQNTPSNTSYETIVTLARSLFSAKALSTNNRPSISSDLGLVGPLLMTISRCTIPQLRWEALALLKAVPRREGMWNAEIAARIAIGVLELEERESQGGLHNIETLDAKIQQLPAKHVKYQLEQEEIETAVVIDYLKTDLVTGQRVLMTETLLRDG